MRLMRIERPKVSLETMSLYGASWLLRLFPEGDLGDLGILSGGADRATTETRESRDDVRGIVPDKLRFPVGKSTCYEAYNTRRPA